MGAAEEIARIKEGADFVRDVSEIRPEVGIILGSGMSVAAVPESATDITFDSIPHFPHSTVRGHSGVLSMGQWEDVNVAVCRGRLHYYEGHAPHEVVFPVRLLGAMGVRMLVLTNAVGGVTFKPGEFMLVRDHINMMGMNPLRGENLEEFGPRFVDASALYDPALRKLAKRAAAKAKVKLREGVFVATMGPTYETPAEITAVARLGADAVGMSVVPEAIAAAHIGLKTMAISLVTNRAAGRSTSRLNHTEVLDMSSKGLPSLRRLLSEILKEYRRESNGKENF